MAVATKEKKDAATKETAALQYAADLVHGALLRIGEPTKVSEIIKTIGRNGFDLRLARVVVATHSQRFTATDRKWTLWSRYRNPEHSVERSLLETLRGFGGPLPLDILARELAVVYGRPTESLEELLPRLLSNSERYFVVPNAGYAPVEWLLDTESETEADVLFDNYLKPETIKPLAKAAAGLNATDADSVVRVLDAVGAPVETKALQFLAWKSSPASFDAKAFYCLLVGDARIEALSNQTWIGPTARSQFESQFAALSEREVDEYAESLPTEPSLPLVISSEEQEQIIKRVLKSESTTRASGLLEDVFEVSKGDANYEGDLATVLAALKDDTRIVHVGADRFLPHGAIPNYVHTVPQLLNIPETTFLDAEGNVVDIILEDDGFDGGLDHDVAASVAQDVLDQDLVVPPDGPAPATVRCVLKYHHKEIGTVPLCMLPPDFFPADAPVLQADLVLPGGQVTEIWISNETKLMYGLLDWFMTIPVDSGAVFYLERQAPDRYALTYGEETEPAIFISRNRVNELIELGRRAETEQLPTFEILREIMEHYRKGIEFITIITEVNIARRSTRRLCASLLSGFHCFFQRGRSWVYDAKKLSQGFDKSKRKYLKKS